MIIQFLSPFGAKKISWTLIENKLVINSMYHMNKRKLISKSHVGVTMLPYLMV